MRVFGVHPSVIALDDTSEGRRELTRLGPSRKRNGRSFRGFNLFCQQDLDALVALVGPGCLCGSPAIPQRAAKNNRCDPPIL